MHSYLPFRECEWRVFFLLPRPVLATVFVWARAWICLFAFVRMVLLRVCQYLRLFWYKPLSLLDYSIKYLSLGIKINGWLRPHDCTHIMQNHAHMTGEGPSSRWSSLGYIFFKFSLALTRVLFADFLSFIQISCLFALRSLSFSFNMWHSYTIPKAYLLDYTYVYHIWKIRYFFLT